MTGEMRNMDRELDVMRAERDAARMEARMNLCNDAQRDREAELTQDLDAAIRERDEAARGEAEAWRQTDVMRAERDAARADAARLMEALKKADYRLAEVSNYLGPFDHKLMFGSLTETVHEARAALAATPPAPVESRDARDMRVAEAVREALVEKFTPHRESCPVDGLCERCRALALVEDVTKRLDLAALIRGLR